MGAAGRFFFAAFPLLVGCKRSLYDAGMMRIMILPLVLWFALAAPLLSYGQVEASRTTFASILANVRFYRLSNGVRVILYPRPMAPVFAGFVGLRVGAGDENIGETGISHLLEHMAFKGTPEIGTRDYEKEKTLLQELEILEAERQAQGALLAAQRERWQEVNRQLLSLWDLSGFTREYEKRGAVSLNASTDMELTRYYVNLPRSAFKFWCYMESERLQHPVLRQFYQERDVVLEERRMRYEDDPGGKLYELLLSSAFRVHPYRNPVIGYAFDVSRLTAAQLEQFRRRFYVPSNVVVAVVGDLTPEEDIKIIEVYFGRISGGGAPVRPPVVEPLQEGERRIVLETAAAPQLLIAYHKPNYPHPDDPPLSIMQEILAGGKLSPLYVEIVKKRRLATSLSHDEGPGFAYPNLMIFRFITRQPHSNGEVLQAFDRTISAFKKGPPTAEALEIAKRAIAMQYLSHLDSNLALASELAAAELIYNNWKAPLEWYDKAMAVTADDVERVAKKYLLDARRTVAEIRSQGKP